MTDDRAITVSEEVCPAHRVQPVVLGEAVLARWERRPQELAQLADVLRAQIGRRDAANGDALDHARTMPHHTIGNVPETRGGPPPSVDDEGPEGSLKGTR